MTPARDNRMPAGGAPGDGPVRKTFFRYLPVSPADKLWGLYVTTAGYIWSGAHQDYPLAQHPTPYHDRWEQGRVLQEFQVLYMTRGEGVYESASAGRHPIKAGDAFLVFPGVWHRYGPNPEIGWEGLARDLHVSYSWLRHAFRKHRGFAPHQYQLQLRLNKAKGLLDTTDHPVKVVACQVGFDCPYHFSHVFKRKTGLSPEAWRRDIRGGRQRPRPSNTR